MLYPVMFLLHRYEFDPVAAGTQRIALITLALYVLSSGGLALLGWRRVRSAAAELAAFMARDREQLKKRVRQISR